MTEPSAPPQVLFHEPGASWWWVMAGPLSGLSMLFIQHWAGHGYHLLMPGIFFVLVSGFLALQIKAARIHTSVELTPEALRQGTETIRVAEIVRVYPEATGDTAPKWQSARALGELTGVPRGRTGIGLKLTNDRSAQAWARNDDSLRAELTRLVDEQLP